MSMFALPVEQDSVVVVDVALFALKLHHLEDEKKSQCHAPNGNAFKYTGMYPLSTRGSDMGLYLLRPPSHSRHNILPLRPPVFDRTSSPPNKAVNLRIIISWDDMFLRYGHILLKEVFTSIVYAFFLYLSCDQQTRISITSSPYYVNQCRVIVSSKQNPLRTSFEVGCCFPFITVVIYSLQSTKTTVGNRETRIIVLLYVKEHCLRYTSVPAHQ